MSAERVDAHQLQLRAHVEAGEKVVAPADVGERGARHLVTGRDQAVAAPVVGRALADGVDGRVGGPAALVDRNAAADADRQFGRPRQLVAGADAGRKNHRVDVQLAAVGEPERANAAVAGDDLLARRGGVHDDTEILDPAAQHRPARII